MSVKLRMTLWITLMVLLLAAMVLVFVFVSKYLMSVASTPLSISYR